MPTTSEVNTAATNFIADTDTADAKINGAAGNVTDRHGTTTKNLEQILADIGFDAPVAFTSGLTPTSGRFTVTYSGNVYHANPSEFPFTTTSTFDTDQWNLLSGHQDYVSIDTVLSSVTPSYPTGTILRARKENVSYIVLDPSSTEFDIQTSPGGVKLNLVVAGPVVIEALGAKPNVTSDQSVKMNAVCAAVTREGGGWVFLNAGTYWVDHTNSFTYTNNVTVFGTANATCEIKALAGDADADGFVVLMPQGVTNVGLRDVTIDGNKANMTGTRSNGNEGLSLNANGMDVRNVTVCNTVSDAFDCDEGSNLILRDFKALSADGRGLNITQQGSTNKVENIDIRRGTIDGCAEERDDNSIRFRVSSKNFYVEDVKVTDHRAGGTNNKAHVFFENEPNFTDNAKIVLNRLTINAEVDGAFKPGAFIGSGSNSEYELTFVDPDFFYDGECDRTLFSLEGVQPIIIRGGRIEQNSATYAHILLDDDKVGNPASYRAYMEIDGTKLVGGVKAAFRPGSRHVRLRPNIVMLGTATSPTALDDEAAIMATGYTEAAASRMMFQIEGGWIDAGNMRLGIYCNENKPTTHISGTIFTGGSEYSIEIEGGASGGNILVTGCTLEDATIRMSPSVANSVIVGNVIPSAIVDASGVNNEIANNRVRV